MKQVFSKKRLLFLSVLIGMVFVYKVGFAGSNTFTETFTYGTYKDVTNTTADWNTGSGVLQLPLVPGTATQKNADLARDSSGYFYFVWLDFRDGGSYGNIRAQKYDSSGVKQWTNDVRVNVNNIYYPGTSTSAPHIALDSSNNVYITWNSSLTEVSPSKVWAQKLNSSGVEQWAADIQVNATNNSNWYGSDIVCDSNGNIYVVFELESGSGIYIQKLNGNGARPAGWEFDKPAVLAGGGDQYDPSIAHYNGSSYFYVVYRGGSGGYYLNRLNSDGVIQWAANVTVSGTSDTGNNNVCVAADATGIAAVAFAKGGDIYVKEYNPSGSPVWTSNPDYSVRVSSDTYVQKNVEISVDDSNDIYLAWLDKKPNDTDFNVYAQKILSNGNISWTTGEKKVNKDDTIDQDGANVVEYGGGCFVCWSDGRASETSVYANRLNYSGTRQFSEDIKINSDTSGYQSSAQGQSLNIDTVSENITSATLTATQTLNGQTINYSLSNDNGANWFAITSGVQHNFSTTGSALRWRAELSTAASSQTPTVETIQIVYNYATASFSLTQVYPDSGLNNGSKTITIWGANFSGTPTVKLRRTGQSDIIAGAVNLIAGNRIQAIFNLTGASPGVWDVVVENGGIASLKKAFTINSRLSTITWNTQQILDDTTMDSLTLGDANNDGNLEIYCSYNSTIYQFKWNGISWDKTDIATGNYVAEIIIGDGNEDGNNEIYFASSDKHIYQLKWNGSSWDKTDVGSTVDTTNDYWYGLAAGDGNNDGKAEIYGTCGAAYDGHIYQFKWNGAGWDRVEIGTSSVSYLNKVKIGDGNNDGNLEVYAASSKYIYQFKFNGSSWNKTEIGQARSSVNDLAVNDANNDGALEIYAGSSDCHLYQLKWNGAGWDKTDMGSGGSSINRLTAGDSDNDGQIEIYAINSDKGIYQFKWAGSQWNKSIIGSVTYGYSYYDEIALGDVDEDGKIDVYAIDYRDFLKFSPVTDAGAPKVVADLTASSSTAPGEINLTWTAPGDDENTGNNSGGHYLVRYANTPIVTEADFNSATEYPNSWIPATKGAAETHYIGGLTANTTYNFAIKTQDEVPYTSGVDTGTLRAVAKVRKTPFYTRSVYDDTWHFPASGFMGESNGSSMSLSTVAENPVEGTKCEKLVYNAESESWVGLFVLNNGWGGQGVDLNQYNGLVFKLRAAGTSIANMEIRYGIGENTDSCGEIRSDWIKVPGTWQTYALDLSGKDLSSVNGVFMIAIRGPMVGSPCVYLDDVKYVGSGSFAISDLKAVSGTVDGEVVVNWTTPVGGDADIAHYSVKYSTNPINSQAGFDSANTFAQLWVPKTGGEKDSHIINGLTPGILYYIAIEAVDINGAEASLSNTSGNSAVAGTSATINITSIAPASSTNNGNKQITIYGLGFASGVTAKLKRTGYSDIVGTDISIISGSEIRVYFNLNGKQTGLWNVYVERNGHSAVLENGFSITTPVSSPNYWVTEYIGAFEDNSVKDIAFGDIDKDGVLELYGANYDKHVYRYLWDGSKWNKTDVGSGENTMYAVVTGDGNNDGEKEVYSGGTDGHIYQFKRNGPGWDKQDLGNTGTYMDGIAVGDGNNDGQMEVYGGGYDGHVYQFRWTGTLWEKTDLGSGSSFMYSVTIGDGNNDGQMEVYGGNASGKIYQFKWNGTNWDKTEVGVGGTDSYMYRVNIGDGNNDGTPEIYGASGNGSIYQFKWNGTTWDKTEIDTRENAMYGVVVGDGDNDGNMEVYGANTDGRIYQYTWDGSTWAKERIDSGAEAMYNVLIGDGNSDGKMEVYGANSNGFIYKFNKIETPVAEFLKEEYVYKDKWQYPASGLMGEDDGKSITLNAYSADNPAEGKYSNKITYNSAKESWAGFFAQASGKWRANGGKGISLAGYVKLTFKARIAEENSDAIQVQYGFGEGGDTASFRSCWFTLTTDWQEFVIDLKGRDLSNINGLFMFNMREISPVDPQVYLDDIKFIGPGPAAFTDLQASRGPSAGSIRLIWTVPQGGVTSYVVKYSTNSMANQQDFNNSTAYSQSWTPASPGSTEDKVITGLTSGGYYYVAVESIDASGNQSSLSNVAPAMARTSGIGIMLDPSSISLKEVKASETVVSATAIGVTNIGGVPITLDLSLVEPPGWKSSTTGVSMNSFVLNAAFATAVDKISWDISKHALSPTVVLSTDTKFAGDQTGVNIPLDGVRNLWVQFIAPPLLSVGTGSQMIYINISAEAVQ